ncbi:MAG TPA: hypothetical protein PKE29_15235 [Phycisphaerales bacterium]|nr:hypothetical protein [Phycisphaerales bacterium]
MPLRTHGPRLHAPLTFDDLVADLTWPRLLRAGHLALRPSRLGMALAFLVGLLLLVGLADKVDQQPGNALADSLRVVAIDMVQLVRGSNPPPPEGGAGARVGRETFAIFASTPAYLVRTSPWVAFLVLPLMAIWTALCGGAICRSAACEFAQGVGIEWPKAVGFALSRWWALTGALVGPILLAWAIMIGMAVAGWALFSLPVVNLLGAAVWPLFLLGGLVVSIVMLAYLVGWPMLLPSVACEGTDAVDAVQHAYSFVLARPLRLAVYLVILIVQMLVLMAIVGAVFWLAIHVAQKCGMQWSGVRGADALGALPEQAVRGVDENANSPLVRGVVNLWSVVPVLLPLAFAASFVWCGSTILYLAMRRVVDGQDVHEIWMPGMVAGTMAAHGGPAAPIPAPAAPADAVSDTGPADET